MTGVSAYGSGGPGGTPGSGVRRGAMAGGAMAGDGDSFRALVRAANALLQQRRYHAALAVIKGFRNGAV